MEAPYDVIDHRINHFITKYESDFRNSAAKIFDGLTNTGTFSSNVLRAARQYTEEDRKQVQIFGMGVTQLLFQVIPFEHVIKLKSLAKPLLTTC